MRSVTERMVWVFAFTVPWDVVVFSGIGTISRVAGLVALMAAALTTVAEGRFRRPDAILGFAVAFTGMAALSILWSVSPGATLQRSWTYVQLVAMVWMVREFARSHERQQALLFAFCLGAFVPLIEVMNNFRTATDSSVRFAMAGFNANDLGLTLAIALPMAWHLAIHQRGLIRMIPVAYLMLAPVAILLTGSRGSFLAALVALSIVPLTFPRLSMRSISVVGAVLIVAGVAAAMVVPEGTWARISTIQTELSGDGRLTGRVDIWRAGLDLFPSQPLLGVGAGAFGPAVERAINLNYAPHNAVLAILVEQGVVGFVSFALLLGACGATIARLPRADRILWTSVMLCWLVGVMSVNWQYRKATWLLFGLIAAQSVAKRATSKAVPQDRAPISRSDATGLVRSA